MQHPTHMHHTAALTPSTLGFSHSDARTGMRIERFTVQRVHMEIYTLLAQKSVTIRSRSIDGIDINRVELVQGIARDAKT